MTLPYSWTMRALKIAEKFPWYQEVINWNQCGLVSDEELKDGVRYLENYALP